MAIATYFINVDASATQTNDLLNVTKIIFQTNHPVDSGTKTPCGSLNGKTLTKMNVSIDDNKNSQFYSIVFEIDYLKKKYRSQSFVITSLKKDSGSPTEVKLN